MQIGIRRMVAEMLRCTPGFVLAIGCDHSPAELERENRQNEHDETTGSHRKSIARYDAAFRLDEKGLEILLITSNDLYGRACVVFVLQCSDAHPHC